MKKLVITVAAAAVCMSSGTAFAGGWGKTGGGLLNLSPSVGVGVGNITALNGISVLNGSPILSGNNVSGILSGNHTGILQGIGIDLFGKSTSYSVKNGKRR